MIQFPRIGPWGRGAAERVLEALERNDSAGVESALEQLRTERRALLAGLLGDFVKRVTSP